VRSGQGPFFLEFKTYRWREHCGAGFDNHIGYRKEAEFSDWKKRDPLENYSKKLMSAGLLTDEGLHKLSEKISAEIAEAMAFGRKSPFPRGLADFVYSI
jgi:pyruvate dehydrogenase E1 component alpha subunit